MNSLLLIAMLLSSAGLERPEPRTARPEERAAIRAERAGQTGHIANAKVTRPELLDGLRPERKLIPTGEFAGSNGGQWMRDEAGGMWFGKPSKGDALQLDRQANEQAMNDIYRLAGDSFGVAVPETQLATVEGQPMFLSKKLASPIVNSAPSDAARAHFADGFVIDAWLANWDIGARHQLVVTADGRLPRIDNGGAGLFRARGDPKGDRFGATVVELTSMRNPSMVSAYSFGRLSPSEIQTQIDKFAAWYPSHAAGVAAAVDHTPLSPVLKAELRTRLQARAAWLIAHATTRVAEAQ